MRDPGETVTAAFPRPGRALKSLLATIAVFAVAGAILLNWGPPGLGASVFRALAFDSSNVLARPWTLVTSGVLTVGFSHALWSLVGVYFLTTDLERRWGAARLLRFVAASIVFGNLAVLAVSRLPFGPSMFHPDLAFGPTAIITATSLAWAKENRHAQIRFFFFLPMSGRTLYWVTIGIAVLLVVFGQQLPEGAVAPLGGCAAGVLFGGTPSPVRALWLRTKLGLLRRRGTPREARAMGGADRPRAKRGAKGPPLRVVYGGLEDELKNRKPPKDKRYLN